MTDTKSKALQENFDSFCELADLTDTQKLLLNMLLKQAYMDGEMNQIENRGKEIEKTLTAMEASVDNFHANITSPNT